MNVLKQRIKKEGSVIIGLLLLTSILIPFFIFTFESVTLFVLKEKTQNVADNIASASVMQLDESLLKIGILKINEKNASAVGKRILDESYSIKKDSLYFDKLDMGIATLNKLGDKFRYEEQEFKYKDSPELIAYTELTLKDTMFFYKNIKIVAVSKSRVYAKGNVSELFSCLIRGKYIECLRFENR